MKFDKQLILLLALKKAETIYFNGGDWKGFVIKLAEIEKELEKGHYKESFLRDELSLHHY